MRFIKSSLGVAVFALSLFAQTDRGTLTGTISDPAGAVVANAAVEAKNTATGVLFGSRFGNGELHDPATPRRHV